MSPAAADFVLPCVIFYVVWRISVVYSAVSTYGKADIYPAFVPLSLLGITFGMGITWTWNQRPDAYGDKEYLRITPLLWGYTVLYSRSPDVLRQVAGGGSNKTWIKPTWASDGLLIYGENLATVNLDTWRRHRRIMQPSFSKSTYELVWRETTRIYEEMVEAEKWDTNSGGIVTLKSVNQLTFKLGLAVIGSCGFGLASKFTWKDPPRTQNGYGNVQSNIVAVERGFLLLQFAPKWLWKLPFKSLRNTWGEYNSLRNFIDEEVANRKAVIDEVLKNGGDEALESVNQDVFSRLVLANQADGKQSLSNSELAGNTFVLLFAGHDTTSSTLAAAIALLAYHQEEQEKAHQEVIKVIEENPDFDFSLFSQLPHIMAIFLEAVRLYPAGELAIRTCLEDTIIRVPSEDGKTPPTDIVMPTDSAVVVDFIAMQYHPRLFPDPMAFRPSRWIGAGEDSAIAFSTGARTCIGKKFAQTEATCFLTNLLRDYKIEPLLKAGETREGWKRRILGNIKVVLTLSITDVPVRLVRR